MLEDYSAAESDDGFPIKPQRVLHDIRQVLGQEDILISDVGAHKMWIGRQYNCYHPNTCIISNGYASMGISVPGAIAAKLIYPEKKVLAVSGDGGFMMNCRSTHCISVPHCGDDFQRQRLWADSLEAGGSLRFQLLYGFHQSGFREVCGEHGRKGLPHSERRECSVLEDAFSQNVPCIIDCPIDWREHTPFRAASENGCMDCGASVIVFERYSHGKIIEVGIL